MKILIVGSGGREHALAWKVAQSVLAKKVYVAPGNAGTELENNIENIPISGEDIEGLIAFCLLEKIDIVIVGPEAPLAKGIVDRCRAAGIRCFGPTQAASQLESSKAFCKDFLARYSIPTAEYKTFSEVSPAIQYIRDNGVPIVVKADGLAAGKGVIVAQTEEEAIAAVRCMLEEKAFGTAGQRIVIEKFLDGEEASFIIMANGEQLVAMATSQDHKARDNGDKGPNTGGMGAYSPAAVVTPEIHKRIIEEIIRPTLNGMLQEGIPYTGFLYAGLMIGKDGTIFVLEFNCRLGDPETQPILLRLKSDLLVLCLAVLENNLEEVTVEWDERTALGVVMAMRGYPFDYAQGELISGLSEKEVVERKVFHAATKRTEEGIVTAGGRVLCVCALGNNVAEAQQKAYEQVSCIHWDSVYYRTDIGYRAIE